MNHSIHKNSIFLIGGGEIIKKETIHIDTQFLDEAGGKQASILFFPTAAGDSEGYTKNFSKYFHFLGCNNVSSAMISKESFKEIEKKINQATGIYLSGGDTKTLINGLSEKGIDSLIVDKIKRGFAIAGFSAGASALGEIAVISEIEEDLLYSQGFGALKKLICLPHYEDKYSSKLEDIKKQYPKKRILGIPECSAIWIKDGEEHLLGEVKEI